MAPERKVSSRREFLGKAALGMGFLGFVSGANPAKGKEFRVGLIGCGGRGNGALRQIVQAGRILGAKVRVVGVADYFKEKAVRTGSRYGLRPARCFAGPKAYKKLLDTDVQIVLMATPPLFRPLHLEACIEAGKHAFIEKPVAVDPPGCRRVIECGKKAKEKGLCIISGTEMRHDWDFRLTHQAVSVEGALGRLYAGRIAFCTRHFFRRFPIRPKTPEDLIASWQNWIALSGDHIVEQHVHNIDVANWFVGRVPVSAVGFGFRARRPAGDMYDFFSVDYDYGQGVHIHSMCRQISGCWNWVGHDFVYEKGRTNGRDFPKPRRSPIPKDLVRGPSSSVQEQLDVLYYVGKGEGVDQARAVAESTATAIMGRISAYTGKQVFWDEIMGDPKRNPALYNLTLRPTAEDFERGTVEIPKEGVVPVPGVPA